MKKYLVILIFIVESLSAAYMKVTIKNNSFDIYSSCSSHYFDHPYYTCDKIYTIELHSKYHIFENYSIWSNEILFGQLDEEHSAKIITNLYTITPKMYSPNKSDLYLRITEEDLKKILQSKEVKILLPITMFSKKLLDKEMTHSFGSNSAFHYYKELEPTILLNMSNISFNELKNQCEKNYKECKAKKEQEEKERNKPINRLKRFFGVDQ